MSMTHAVHFICLFVSDYSPYSSVTPLKTRAESVSLLLRRQHARRTLFFHEFCHHERFRNDFFPSPSVTFPQGDHSCKVRGITSDSFMLTHSFIPRTTIEWNNLSQHIATESNI